MVPPQLIQSRPKEISRHRLFILSLLLSSNISFGHGIQISLVEPLGITFTGDEGDLKDALVLVLKEAFPGAAVFRHEDKFTAGIPDISLNWHGLTTWVEVKYLNPKFKGLGIQYVTALKLEREARCLYALYARDSGESRTAVVLPSELKDELSDGKLISSWDDSTGFDHRYVAEQIRRYHVYGKE